ncbi:MAG: hypothetical protein GXO86_03935 [Chlorobi bacterium]|nr:hypothetical protein [Chlorobiota bacterium]
MKYIKLDSSLIDLSAFYKDLTILLLELDDNGRITKEIGLNNRDFIIHRFPSLEFKHGKYGIFDLNTFDLSNLKDDISKEEFYNYWNRH